MTIIVNKDIHKVIINRPVSGSGDEKVFHVQQDSDIILLGIEEIKHKGEES